MVTVLVLCWLYFEGQSQQKISNHAWYTFWYVLPTLPMFAAFPLLLPRFGFALTLLASVVITAVCFFITALFAPAPRRPLDLTDVGVLFPFLCSYRGVGAGGGVWD